MNESVKTGFHHILVLAGMIIIGLFFADVTVTSVTTYQVNRQLGFRYATPDTPDGELIVITRVAEGKAMDTAGVKPGDEVHIPILRDKKIMMISVWVPEMDIPLKDISFLIF